MHEFLYERPRTVESIHRTSVASSLDENRELKDDEETPPDTSRWVPVGKNHFFTCYKFLIKLGVNVCIKS